MITTNIARMGMGNGLLNGANLFSVMIYVFFAMLLLWGSRPAKVEREEDYFSNFNSLRGLFAIEIVIGHVIRYESGLLYPLGKFMIISVAYFFFVSAYGLTRSFHLKEKYLEHFLFRKCVYLLAIAGVAFVFRTLLLLCAGRYESSTNIFRQFLNWTNWYIWELLIFYVLFYVVYRNLSKYRITVIALVTVLMITVLFFTGAKEMWFASALAFPAGLVFYEHFGEVTGFLGTFRGKWVVLLLTAAGLAALFLGEDSYLGMVWLRNAMCLAGICILFYFLSCVSTGNRFLRKLGKYSAELYLYQFIYLNLVNGQWDFRIRILVVCALTGLTAVIMHPVNDKIRQEILRIS